ncbi:CYTH domain protein [bacterium BMS3Bbin14]|nr:CYTH domain protein [bacterium BMS3Abin13]GBE53113.1 CYTH domain protein [bacterium BMS3Bbin14]HDL98504.1 CYTH domain-containing protein [Desulfobacteraceae bacterium]HDO30973.1 CYTH domain-containing protein [Desulfobacteraceae bacterium]HDZ76306.1 CYTH domain-containing protein [Desulfobacteraceae bacterium]
MGIEIERKFLVEGWAWKDLAPPIRCRQGYLCLERDKTVRVRIMGNRGFLTVKGGGAGIVRHEFEYEIPVADAAELLAKFCRQPLIEKDRYKIEYEGMVWEVDEFFGENRGLVIAEVELERADQVIARPAWVGREVSGDPRYFNAALSRQPFCSWPGQAG